MLSEERKRQMREYNAANKDKVAAASIRYTKRRLANPLYHEEFRIRNLIRAARKYGGYKKNSCLNDILGCSYEQYFSHIESTWEDWMNWDNYGRGHGRWSIDHIIPVSSATTIEQVRELFHYTNVRAYSSVKNTVKSNKIE